jgi:hypothetical protein
MNFRDERPTLLEPHARHPVLQGMRKPATRRRVAVGIRVLSFLWLIGAAVAFFADPNMPSMTPWESLAGAALLAAPAALGILFSLFID